MIGVTDIFSMSAIVCSRGLSARIYILASVPSSFYSLILLSSLHHDLLPAVLSSFLLFPGPLSAS